MFVFQLNISETERKLDLCFRGRGPETNLVVSRLNLITSINQNKPSLLKRSGYPAKHCPPGIC